MRFKILLNLFLGIMLLAGCNNIEKNEPTHPEDSFESESTEDIFNKDVTQTSFGINDIDFTNLHHNEIVSLDVIFKLDDALFRTSQMGEALGSFTTLTEKVEGKVPKDMLEEIGNISWEHQYLGFHNWKNSVEGTLIKQDFNIKKLEIELAIKQLQLGEIDQTALSLIAIEFENAKETFQLLLDSYRPAD